MPLIEVVPSSDNLLGSRKTRASASRASCTYSTLQPHQTSYHSTWTAFSPILGSGTPSLLCMGLISTILRGYHNSIDTTDKAVAGGGGKCFYTTKNLLYTVHEIPYIPQNIHLYLKKNISQRWSSTPLIFPKNLETLILNHEAVFTNVHALLQRRLLKLLGLPDPRMSIS